MGNFYRTCWTNLILFFLCTSVLAEDIPPPPPSEDIGMSEQKYFEDIKNNLHNTPITDTRPNGNRQGRYGDQVGWATGSIVELYICDSSPDGTSWHKVDTNPPPPTAVNTNQLAKAWVNFVGTGGSVGNPLVIKSSYNVTSVTYLNTGKYQVNWTTPFADNKYACVATGFRSTTDVGFTNTMGFATGYVVVWTENIPGTNTDFASVSIVTFSN